MGLPNGAALRNTCEVIYWLAKSPFSGCKCMMVSHCQEWRADPSWRELWLDRLGVGGPGMLYLYVRGDPGALGLGGGDPT